MLWWRSKIYYLPIMMPYLMVTYQVSPIQKY